MRQRKCPCYGEIDPKSLEGEGSDQEEAVLQNRNLFSKIKLVFFNITSFISIERQASVVNGLLPRPATGVSGGGGDARWWRRRPRSGKQVVPRQISVHHRGFRNLTVDFSTVGDQR